MSANPSGAPAFSLLFTRECSAAHSEIPFYGDPVLNTRNPQGISAKSRRRTLDALQELNHETFAELADDETVIRIALYEMAFRMQTSV